VAAVQGPVPVLHQVRTVGLAAAATTMITLLAVTGCNRLQNLAGMANLAGSDTSMAGPKDVKPTPTPAVELVNPAKTGSKAKQRKAVMACTMATSSETTLAKTGGSPVAAGWG
jgi:hypothetical protein